MATGTPTAPSVESRKRPVGTLAELKEFYRNPKSELCCHEPVPGTIAGCPRWDECPFKQKGVSGPVMVAYRLYKPGPKIGEGYAQCSDFLDQTNQYNKNEGYIREILGFGKGEDPDNPDKVVTVSRFGTKLVAGTVDQWEEEERIMEVPPVMRLKDQPAMRMQAKAKELLDRRKAARTEAQMDAALSGANQREIARAAFVADMETSLPEKDEE